MSAPVEKGTGPPGRLPAARATNSSGQGDAFQTTNLVARLRRICKRKCADAVRLACVCLSYEELAGVLATAGGPLMSAARILKFTHRFRTGALCEIEIDLEAVRDNTFTPRFRWNGRKHKAARIY